MCLFSLVVVGMPLLCISFVRHKQSVALLQPRQRTHHQRSAEYNDGAKSQQLHGVQRKDQEILCRQKARAVSHASELE